jgi:hypothetical protein
MSGVRSEQAGIDVKPQAVKHESLLLEESFKKPILSQIFKGSINKKKDD